MATKTGSSCSGIPLTPSCTHAGVKNRERVRIPYGAESVA
ncbi:hypothetical protein AKJ09_05559 [Labilithrix luteola]|uniref:Uncharacterized protein n=1 Tax=Labilithrix luteola TaxID=1391654 RepID=A0A0K1PZD3_9BACT|nr:hypothetical protein AKJ09_05559 [Labilithrix luteola]